MSVTRNLFQLDKKPTWFENIAVRSNGSILVTRLDVPEVMEVDPKTGAGRSIFSVQGVTSLTGISELTPDVFAVGGGDYNFQSGPVKGSFGVWVADLTGPEPQVRLAAKTPAIGLLNGMATWDADTVVAADSQEGKVYKINLKDGANSVCLEDEKMTSAPNLPLVIGVNGIKIREENGAKYVYFTSTTRELFARVPVDDSIRATGPVEDVSSGFLMDDFCFGADGSAYVVTHPTNMVMRVPPKGGEAVKIAGDYGSFDVACGTSCAVGRGEGDKGVLYVCTGGANSAPINGETEPAKVVAITLEN